MADGPDGPDGLFCTLQKKRKKKTQDQFLMLFVGQ